MPSSSLFLMMIRALKLMDFQPYLGIITRSLSTAALSLIHFFLLAFMIFLTFSIFGFIVFGGEIQAVRSLGVVCDVGDDFLILLLKFCLRGSSYWLHIRRAMSNNPCSVPTHSPPSPLPSLSSFPYSPSPCSPTSFFSCDRST